MARVKDIVREVDIDGNNEVDFEEFLTVMAKAKTNPNSSNSAIGLLSG